MVVPTGTNSKSKTEVIESDFDDKRIFLSLKDDIIWEKAALPNWTYLDLRNLSSNRISTTAKVEQISGWIIV